jgi:hypothetical protein
MAYSTNGCLRFYTFIFWYCQIWLNILVDDCPFEQHHKIETKNTGPNAMTWEFLGSNIRISLEITFLSLQSRGGDNCTKKFRVPSIFIIRTHNNILLYITHVVVRYLVNIYFIFSKSSLAKKNLIIFEIFRPTQLFQVFNIDNQIISLTFNV